VIVAAATVLDSDDDGVADEEDNCPTTPNTAQTDGDDDGAGDSCHECSPTPLAGCKRPVTPGKALLMLRDRTADRRDMLSWQWLEGEATMKAEFGDPVSSDTYALCLYDGSGLVTSARVPHGGFCNRGKPCWTERRHGFAYADQGLTPDGILSVVLREGIEDGKTKVIVKARGGLLGLPDPGSLSSPLTVQLHRAGGPCWESVYGAPFLKQQPGFLKDRAD
jgi:hypothetical protein